MARDSGAGGAWTIGRVLSWTQGYLGRKGDERPRLSAEWLLSAATGLSRVELYMNYDKPLNEDELARMHAGVERRAAGEPLQYVTGEMPFRHIVVHCERGVLIPRPETEVLVDAALEGMDRARLRQEPGNNGGTDARLAVRADTPRVLEVGTGSGCIACSIASERPDARVTCTDVSARAAALAKRNRDALGLSTRVRVVETDLVHNVDSRLMGTFDVLVSNPPYIPSAVVPTLPQEVIGFEPRLALDGGADGLDVFRRILAVAPAALRPGGWLCVELFEDNVAVAARLCEQQCGWQSVEVREDLTHRPRVLVAVREGDLLTPLAPDVLAGAARAERRVAVSQEEPDTALVRCTARVLGQGGVAVLPTDSVYGLACAATPGNPAHGRIFEMKHRDRSQTLPLFIAEPEDILRFGRDVPEYALDLARRFWPGALTLVVPASSALPPQYVQGDARTVALRVPASPLVRQLVREVGVPLAQTSANTHGAPAATSAEELEDAIFCQADVVLDAGRVPLGTPSTIVDATGARPRVLRAGAIDPFQP